MPFSEATKLEAKRRAHFSCVVCHQVFVEVHHIVPQAAGGTDDLDNAAPLCASCHDRYGANPDKRKQIREMRDLWYELCETRFRDSPSLQLAEAVEGIKNQQHEHGAILNGVKELLASYYADQSRWLAAASTAVKITSLSGVTFPQDFSSTGLGEVVPPEDYATRILGRWLGRRKYVAFYADGRWGVQRNEDTPIEIDGRRWQIERNKLLLTFRGDRGLITTENTITSFMSKQFVTESDGHKEICDWAP